MAHTAASEAEAGEVSLALVPFSAASPYHNPKALEERFFDFGDFEVRVKQGWLPDGKGGTELGFGAAVYEAAVVLADWLRRDGAVRGRRVLELGAGVGLVAVAAAKLGAREVVASDGDAVSLRLARENCARNGVAVACRRLRWGDADAHRALGGFDVVLGSDIVARPYREHFPALRETLLALTRPGGALILAQKPRCAEERVFLDGLAADAAFVLERRVPPRLLHADFEREDISVWVFRRADAAAAPERQDEELLVA